MLAAFAAVFGTVMAGEYLLFGRALAALRDLGPAGRALTLYLVESVLGLVFGLALLSFVASGLWIYYRAADTRLLLATPLPLGALYALRSLETFALTSWTLAVVGLPALAALGRAWERGPAFYAEGLAVLACFGALTAGLGALLTVAAGALLRRPPGRLPAALVLGLLLGGAVLLLGRQLVPSAGDFVAVFDPGVLNGTPSAVKFIEARFRLWPSHPFAAALYTAATGGAAGSPAASLAVWVAPLVALAAAALVGRAVYRRTLPAVAEALSGPAGPAPGGRPRFPRWLGGRVGALLERDLVTMARSPQEWGRAGFMALLLLVYTSFIVVAPLREVADRPPVVARLLLFTIVATGYFLTAFGLRYTFPSTSLEGRAAWVFFSSPVPRARLLLARAGLHAGLVAAAVVPIALLGVVRLVPDPALTAAAAGLLVLTAVTTTTVLLAAGTAWPDFREPSADALSTSGGGLGATVVCLAYVTAIGWIGRGVVLARAGGADVIPWLGAAAGLSGALVAGSLLLALHRAPRLEAP